VSIPARWRLLASVIVRIACLSLFAAGMTKVM
jgi:hypothetical protein